MGFEQFLGHILNPRVPYSLQACWLEEVRVQFFKKPKLHSRTVPGLTATFLKENESSMLGLHTVRLGLHKRHCKIASTTILLL